jgi:hypothetical protein
MATYGKTYLQLTNLVLERMREGTVATVTENTYSTLVGHLINQVKNEIEQAFYWNALRDTYSINTVADTTSYTFTGAGPDAAVIDAWDTTSQTSLKRGTNKQFDLFYFGVASASIRTGAPEYYIPAGVDADYDLRIDLLPKPDAVYVLKVNVYKPQDDLSASGDVALIPQSVLIEEVIARLLNERGDEAAPKAQPGETFIMRDLLAAAVAREAGHAEGDLDWEPE